MDPLVVALIVLIVVIDLAFLALVVTRARSATSARKQAYSEWLDALQKDPLLMRLYEAHWKTRWRTGVASLVDGALSMGTAATLAFVLAPRLGLQMEDKAFALLAAALFAAAYFGIVDGGLKLYGSTPGLRLLGIAIVSARTGRPAAPHERRPPTKWDYRRDRVPGLLFVPASMLGSHEPRV